MDICVVLPNYYRNSGVTVAVERLYNGGRDLPVRWHFIDCQYGEHAKDPKTKWYDDSNAVMQRFELMSTNPFRFLKEFIRFYDYTKRNKISIVHFHHRRLAFTAGFLCKILGLRTIYTAHLSFGRNKIRSLGAMDITIAISPSVREDLEAHENAKTIVEISNAAPFDASVLARPEQTLYRVSIIARLDAVKNHAMLIQAWSRIREKHAKFQLLIIGEGALKADLMAQAEQLGLGDSVVFVGYTNRVSDYIDQSLFLVLPSFLEGQPVAALEAAGRGKATLASDAPGARDIATSDARLPNRIPPSDIGGWALALDTWLSDPQAVLAEGRRFHEYYKALSTPEVVALKHYNIYKELVFDQRHTE